MIGSSWQPQVERIVGRFTMASNATLLAETSDGEPVVYKPSAGERPLWDFAPDTLAAREVLTYRLAQALGLDIVPETVMGDGPFGPGSVQRFVDFDESFDPVPLINRGDERLWPIAVLDVLTNNADRKAGHILVETGSGRMFAIDHGLTFHPDPKLRTVLWSFAGRNLPVAMRSLVAAAVDAASGAVGDEIEAMLGADERRALVGRATELQSRPTHPDPPDDRPAVPWPPY